MAARVNSDDIAELSDFAGQLADISARAILPYFRKILHVENKLPAGQFDPVTLADREAERLMRAAIKHRYPSHGILGEEFGHEAGDVPLTWVLDPIDGTRAFMCGMAHWGTLIALNDGTAPVLGVLNQPVSEERWFAHSSQSFYRKKDDAADALHTRRCSTLDNAVLTTTSPTGYFNDDEQAAFWTLSNRTKLTRFGGDCYAYGLLAMGFIDIIVESQLKPWDIQALIPIIENAGGVVSTWDGRRADEGGRVVACGDPLLHAAVLEVLNAAR